MDSLIEYNRAELSGIDREVPLCVNNAGHYVINSRVFATKRPHGREDYQLIYIVRGRMRVNAGSRGDRFYSEGTVLLFKPNDPQIYAYLNDTTCEAFWIHFYGTLIEGVLKSLNVGNERIIQVGVNHKIPQYINEILIDLMTGRFGADYSNDGRLLLILSEVAKYKNNAVSEINTGNERFGEVLLQMHDTLSNLTVAELADIANLSVSRFTHLFTKQFGLSPHAYQMNIKIERAKYLLVENKNSVKEISWMLGFDDPFYFSRIFKKQTGLSPMQYKNLNK